MDIIVPLFMILFFFVFGICGTILWIWMIIDCATKEKPERRQTHLDPYHTVDSLDRSIDLSYREATSKNSGTGILASQLSQPAIIDDSSHSGARFPATM